MKNKKQTSEKRDDEFISSLMQDKARDRSFADKNRSHNVLSLSATKKYKKEYISSLMKDKVMGLVSEKKVKRARNSSPARDNSRISVSATNINNKTEGFK